MNTVEFGLIFLGVPPIRLKIKKNVFNNPLQAGFGQKKVAPFDKLRRDCRRILLEI